MVTVLEPLIFKLAGFQLKVLARQFPDSHDIWDGNWLNVIGECNAEGSSVRAAGPFVSLSEIIALLKTMESLHSFSSKKGEVHFMEPELELNFEANSIGGVSFSVDFTPDNLSQSHKFIFDIDLNYLSDAISQCKLILETYPIRGAQ